MIPLAPILGMIPSVIKLFQSDKRKEGVQELTSTAINEASKILGVNFKNEDELITHLNDNPKEVVRLRELEAEIHVKMEELGLLKYKEDTKRIKSVNKTMRQETKSEHWQSYSWRPFIGFSFGLYIMSLFVLPLFKVVPVVMSPDMVMAIGAILGVASWYRGKKQEQEIKKQ